MAVFGHGFLWVRPGLNPQHASPGRLRPESERRTRDSVHVPVIIFCAGLGVLRVRTKAALPLKAAKRYRARRFVTGRLREGRMVAWLVLIGIVLIPTAGFLLWSWRSSRNDMALMRATETTKAADVAKLAPGSLVEVKGRLRCASPLTGELSKSPCAHFAATVEREFETWEYDAKRGTSYRARKTEIVQSSTLCAPFEIEDESGRAKVLAEGAIVEGIAAVDRYDAHDEEGGDASLMQAALNAGTPDARTLGFSYKEMHLPLDADIYVLGVVGKNRCIGAPPPGTKGQRFLISVKSEETRAAELGDKSRWMLGLGVFFLVGAVVCLGSAFWMARTGFTVEGPRDVLQNDTWW
jgi:hypothetical protein